MLNTYRLLRLELCQIVRPKSAIIIVDVQNDFISGDCEKLDIYRVSQKKFLLSKMPWQILLLAVRNPYETLGNTSKTPSPSLTTSKCASTCDEFFPNCFVVFQAQCCILLPKIVIPEQRCLQGRNSVSLSDPFLQWSSTGGGVPRTFCLGSRQTLLPNFQMQGFQVRG